MVEALEEKLDAFEEVEEHFIARDNILDSLSHVLRWVRGKKDGYRLTPRRTPTPVKIVFAGENGWRIDDYRTTKM